MFLCSHWTRHVSFFLFRISIKIVVTAWAKPWYFPRFEKRVWVIFIFRASVPGVNIKGRTNENTAPLHSSWRINKTGLCSIFGTVWAKQSTLNADFAVWICIISTSWTHKWSLKMLLYCSKSYIKVHGGYERESPTPPNITKTIDTRLMVCLGFSIEADTFFDFQQ